MKIPKETLELLKEKIESLDTEERRLAYHEDRFPRADRTKDKDKRYRWDLLYATRQHELIYDYKDAHIDTALRKIVPPLN